MNFSHLAGKIIRKITSHGLKLALGLVALLAFAITTSSVPAFDGDYSRSYNFGGGLSAPAPPQNMGRDIINLNAEVDTGGILGCSGLDVGSLVESQLGGIGNIGNLSKDLANAAKTRMFNEALTQLFADPQVASVLEGMQGMAQARIGLLQKNCDASEIYADVTNKRLRAEAMSQCVAERRSMEDCSEAEILSNYLEQVVESPRWSEDLHEQICDDSQSDCDWTALLPNRRTPIDDGSSDDDEDESDGDDEDDGDNGDDQSGNVDPAPEDGEEVPPAVEANDLVKIGFQVSAEVLDERIQAARDFIRIFGYSAAMQAALTSGPELPRVVQDYARANLNNDVDEDEVIPELYTMYQYTQDSSCEYGAETSGITAQLPSFASSNDGIAEPTTNTTAPSPVTADDTPPPAAPSAPSAPVVATPTTTIDTSNSCAMLWPVPGRSISDLRSRDHGGLMTSPYGTRIHPVQRTRRTHYGVDIGYGTGTPLQAAMDSVVGSLDRAGRSAAGRGLRMMNDTYTLRYIHMSTIRPEIRNGLPLRAGTIVGAVGATGGVTGPHLHLEVRIGRTPPSVDPAPILRRCVAGGTTLTDEELASLAVSGESMGGAIPAAAAMSTLPPDDPFVIELQDKMNKLSFRVLSTATCMINKTLHPQVYVQAAMLPGRPGVVDIEAARMEYGDGITPEHMASGDVLGFIQGYSEMIGHDAAVSVLNAVIQEMSMQLAIRSTDGENGMNPALWEYAKGQLALIKFRRSAVASDYKASCRLAQTINDVVSRTDELRESVRSRGRNRYNRDSSERTEIELNCNKYDHLKDDGLYDLRSLYTDWVSGVVAPSGDALPPDMSNELDCIARNIYHESRGESAEGRDAVAWATMNRVLSGRHPGTACEVVYQDNQFEWTQDDRSNAVQQGAAWDDAMARAQAIYEQARAGNIPERYRGITYFHTTGCDCNWHRTSPNLDRQYTIGNHIFYRERG